MPSPSKEDSPSSEVGFAQDVPRDSLDGGIQSNDDKWTKLMEQQNQNFLALIKAMKLPTQPSNLRLPDFDPRKRIWMREHGKPKENECYASYAAALMTSIMSRWNSLSVEKIAIATVLAHISRFDNRVQHLAFTKNIETRNQLQQELQAVSFMKRKIPHDDREGSDLKRPRPGTSNAVTCYHCGKLGHKASQCYRRNVKPDVRLDSKHLRSSDSKSKTHTSTATTTSTITCFHCRELGHYASSCPRRGAGNNAGAVTSKTTTSKRVDLCVVTAPAGTLRHSGEQFYFRYDSGAECSLIKESIASKFCGKRINQTVSMTGIGQTSVISTFQVLAVVEIDDISIEVCFHVLPDYNLHHDILIGYDILSHGLTVQISSSRINFFRQSLIESCDIDREIDFSNINTDLPLESRNELIALLKSFEKYFSSGIPSAPADTEPMKIRLKDPNKTVNRRPYRFSPSERQIVRNKIDELLRAGVIRPSSSPFASPILLVEKKDGSHRLCVDYRELNDNTISDRFPLPLISDQIDRLHGGHFFSILDLASGFHQIRIDDESIERTAFVSSEGQFEYVSMPFGLKNAPAVFQRAMLNALGNLVNAYVVFYMDDLLIVASNVTEALDRLRVVLKTLSDKGFTLNYKKCAFLKEKVEFLGYEVSQGEIRPNPRDGTTVCPTTGTGKLSWKPEHEVIRQKIIFALTNEPVLLIHDPNVETELHTDASAIGYGAVLLQKKDGKLHPVAYYSKRTTSAESKYHSYELETLAVVNAVKYFRRYLHGRFVVVTDCSSLQSTRKKLDLTPRVHRWWAFLQSFDFNIIHREGKRMSHADFFSRNPLPHVAERDGTKKVQQKHVNIAELSDNWLMMEQQRDAEISKIVADLNDNRLPVDRENLRDPRWYFTSHCSTKGKNRCLPMVPRSFRWSVINNVHEGHRISICTGLST
ncbi:Retrovirus-related Pol polyprotein from transposon 17.6 [Eumeta japonica]|uniref:RNA-directed DNA polymerase n=1 Tax=Eumeta variegata TaxID=151549 RepID=A0A4C1ZEQ7_EUMVA|nr:Retrovirus-related Pol polyprotein from transposon 17.6 [Eumeta japonica]